MGADVELKNGETVLFLCDRKACGEVCPNEACTHTGDIRHAKNFDVITLGNGVVDHFEVESVSK